MSPQRRRQGPTMTAKDDNRAEQVTSTATGSPDYSTLEPKFGGIYVIELCSNSVAGAIWGEASSSRYGGGKGGGKP